MAASWEYYGENTNDWTSRELGSSPVLSFVIPRIPSNSNAKVVTEITVLIAQCSCPDGVFSEQLAQR